MAINLYNIKKWLKMLTGKSIYHVNQDLGKQFIPGELRGYFNNMTEKVTKAPELLNSETLPTLKIQSGEEVYFPVIQKNGTVRLVEESVTVIQAIDSVV